MQPNIFLITNTDIMIIKTYLKQMQNVVMGNNGIIEATILRDSINIWRLLNNIEDKKNAK